MQRYFDHQKWQQLILGFLFLTLGGLCKIPAIYLFALLLPLWLIRKGGYQLKIQITCISICSLLIILSWYFLWVPSILSKGGFQLFFTKSISEGIIEMKPYLNDFLKQFYFGALRSYIALLPILLGIIWLFKNRVVALSFLFLTIVFIIFALKTGTVFPTHNYYILPFAPVLAVLAAIGLQRLDSRFSIVLLLLIGCEAIANQWTDFRIKPEVNYRLSLAKQVNQIVPRNTKIILATGSNPEWMYWYHRKGWSIEPTDFSDSVKMNEIRAFGGYFVVIDKRNESEQLLEIPFEKIGETRDCLVYDLRKEAD